MNTRPGIFSKCRKYSDFFADNECSNRFQDASFPEPTPLVDNPHYTDSIEPVYGNSEGVVTGFPMPYYSYPAQGGPVSEDTDLMVHSFGEADHMPNIKMEVDPPWDYLLSLPSLDPGSLYTGTEYGHLWPTSEWCSESFSSLSDIDMMARTGRFILGEFSFEQLYGTSSPALEREEQEFSETETLVPDGFGLQSPIGDQQSEGRTEDDGDFVMTMMMKDEMEAEEEVWGERIGEKEEEMADEEDLIKVEEEGGEMGNNNQDPGLLYRLQLLDERIRNPEPNWGPWGPYRPSDEVLEDMRNHAHALENKRLLSRAGWSAKLLEDLFGSHWMNGQWPLPPPPPPPLN